jgi:hypothetical protein
MRNTLIVTLSIILLGCECQPPRRSLEALEEAGFFEGDMNLSNSEIRDIFLTGQAGVLDTRRRWNRDPITRQVIVPFTIRARSPYSKFINSYQFLELKKRNSFVYYSFYSNQHYSRCDGRNRAKQLHTIRSENHSAGFC